MVSQNAIPSRQYLGGSLPLVFTEQGVAAISAVLTSEKFGKKWFAFSKIDIGAVEMLTRLETTL